VSWEDEIRKLERPKDGMLRSLPAYFIVRQFIFYIFLSVKRKTVPFKFEKLIVWQKALDLSEEVDKLTKTFPKDELYILTSQIKRAADSVSLNIAEGSTGQTNPEFNRFLSYALRSNIEVVGCIFIGKRRNLVTEADFTEIYKMCEEILVMINGLKKSLNL
jgi:four helix bundle protein